MTSATTFRLGLAAGGLGVLGGVLVVLDGRAAGWLGIACGVGIIALLLIERRRPRG